MLEEDDADALAAEFGGVTFPPSVRVKAWRTYGDELWADVTCELRDAVEMACREAGVEEEDIEALVEYEDQSSVIAAAKEMAKTLTAARGKAIGRVPRSAREVRGIAH